MHRKLVMLMALLVIVGPACTDKAKPFLDDCLRLEGADDVKGAHDACAAAVAADPNSSAGKSASVRLEWMQVKYTAMMRIEAAKAAGTYDKPKQVDAGAEQARAQAPSTVCSTLSKWSLQKRYAVDCETPLTKGCEQNNFGVLMAGVIRTTANEKLSADMMKRVIREAMAPIAQKLGDEVDADRAALEAAPSRPAEAEIKKGLLKDYDDFRTLAASWKKLLEGFSGDHNFYLKLGTTTMGQAGKYDDREKERTAACSKLPPE